MATTLPRPTVDVKKTDVSDGSMQVDVVISRDNRGKSYTSTGKPPTDAIKEVIEKIINDPYTGEWIP